MRPSANQQIYRRAWLRLDINAAPHQQRLFLDLPAVRDFLKTRQRIIELKAIRTLMRNGLSLNRASRAFGHSPSWASVLLPRLEAGGEAALAIKRGAGRPRRKTPQPESSPGIPLAAVIAAPR